MRPIGAGRLAQAAGFLAIGIAVALAVALPQRASATHPTIITYVQRGLVTGVNCSYFQGDPIYGQYWIPNSHPCWHDDEDGTRSAIDYTVAGGTTSGRPVWFYVIGDLQHWKVVAVPYFTPCTGVAVAIYEDFTGNENYRRGEIVYLHIDPAGGIIGNTPSYLEYLGTVSASQPGCAWTGPHLHQSANTAPGRPFYFNRWGNPAGQNYQEHTVYWDPSAGDTDDDNDDFGDNIELLMGTDPSDRCADTTIANDERGFNYSQPLSPLPPDANDDRNINVGDLIILLGGGKMLTSVGHPLYSPRSDFNGNGVLNMGDVIIGFSGRVLTTCR
jgi:hypothetical protein